MSKTTKNAAILSLGIVLLFTIWESLVCWNGMIGCQQPWAVGWSQWLSLVIGLLSGPFAPYYSALGLWGSVPPPQFLVGYVPILALLVAPYLWFIIRGRRSVAAPLIGSILWLAAGHLWCIGIYV